MLIELICLICLVNNYVFQVSSENKVDIVIANVPSDLPIPHVFEPLSLNPPWNRQVDNFIKSNVFFANKFMFDKFKMKKPMHLRVSFQKPKLKPQGSIYTKTLILESKFKLQQHILKS
jgi:hypothetical protein